MLTFRRVGRPQEIYEVPLGSRLQFPYPSENPNTTLEIAQPPSRCFNHPMRRTVLSTFLFAAILGPGSPTAVYAVQPGKLLLHHVCSTLRFEHHIRETLFLLLTHSGLREPIKMGLTWLSIQNVPADYCRPGHVVLAE